MTDSIASTIHELFTRGTSKSEIARLVGTSRRSVQRVLNNKTARNEALEALTRRFDAKGTVEVEGKLGRLVQTEQEALEAADIDLAIWEPESIEIRFYPIPIGDGKVKQGSYIKIKCKRRKLAESPERVSAALLQAVEASVQPRVPTLLLYKPKPAGLLRQRIITDLHFGGYAWGKSTGGESWDIEQAVALADACNTDLVSRQPEDVSEVGIAFLGDLCHYDTTKGTTTGGTQLDMDSRADLMLKEVAEFMVRTVALEAELHPVTVHVIEGNHDAMLTKALRRLLAVRFGNDKHVRIVEEFTKRQYRLWGRNLLGFAHGDGNRQRLALNMPYEARSLWSHSTLREIHTGHLHHEAATQKLHKVEKHDGTITEGGVVVRTHLALTPTDQYHSDENWVGSTRGMSDWFYHPAGACVGHHVAVPHVMSHGVQAADLTRHRA